MAAEERRVRITHGLVGTSRGDFPQGATVSLPIEEIERALMPHGLCEEIAAAAPMPESDDPKAGKATKKAG